MTPNVPKLRASGATRQFVFLCLGLAVDVAAAPIDDFAEFVNSEKERLAIPGVSVALIDEGSVSYISLGVRRTGEVGEIASTNAFNIGSISKTVTAWAVMRLVELNLVSLDEPVEQYIGQRWQFPESDFDISGVTLRRILSHTAGLSAPSYQGLPFGSSAIRLEDSLDGFPVPSSRVHVIVEPGTEYRYSGGGFAVAQLVVESVTGRAFEDFVASEVFAPLGMRDAAYLDFDEESLAVAPHDYGGRPITDYRIVEQGAGGLRASAEDLVDFITANMSTNPVLSTSAVDEMHAPITLISGDTRPTLGFERRGGLLSHGGHSRGWVAQIDFHPASRSGLVILTNSANGLHLVQPVRCKWAELFEIDDLENFCEQASHQGLVTDWTLRAISASALLLSVWMACGAIRALRNHKAQIVVDARSVSRSLLSILSIGVTWAVLGTELGVYLASGVRWGLATIGYLSYAAQQLMVALTVLPGILVFTSFVRRIPG